jgi:hypothetical protein
MTTAKEPRRIIGEATCPACGAPIKVRITEKNKLYANCIEVQGGCGAQIFSRSATADKHLARRITKWVDPNERRAYLGEEALPAKARPRPAVASEPEPEPEAEPEPEVEAEPVDEAPPPPQRPTTPRPKRPVPPQFKKTAEAKKSWWEL